MAYVATNSESGTFTGGVSGTFSPSAGSNRIAFMAASSGYDGAASNIWPATLTWGGQTINRVAQLDMSNTSIGIYIAYESDIASFSGGAWSLTPVGSPAGGARWAMDISVYDDVAQTLAASGTQMAASANPVTVSLTTTPGDLCFGAAASRGDYSLGPGAGMTSLYSVTAGAGATEGVVTQGVGATASGGSTDLTVSIVQYWDTVMYAAAMTPQAGGGGSTPTWQLFPSANAYLDDGTINVSTHTFKARLLSDSYTADPTDTVLADTTGALGTDQTVTLSVTGGLVSIASAVSWTGALTNVKHILLYDDTPTSPADPLLALVTFENTQSVPTSTTFTLPAGDVYFR